MRPLVEYPDAELVVGLHIKASIPDLIVEDEVPDSRPAEFVRVERVGGQRRNVVLDRPRVDIHCWSGSKDSALDLMRRVRAYVLAMSGAYSGTTVSRMTEVGGPQWLPDSVSGAPRYAFAVEFNTRGAELE